MHQNGQSRIPDTVQNCTDSKNDLFYVAAVKVSPRGGKAKCTRLTKELARTVEAWRHPVRTDMGASNDTF